MLLLKAVDEKMGLTNRLAVALGDSRQVGKVRHQLREMLQERILGIACGYPDANDAARLSRDPAMLLACERRGESLASQPTLSRYQAGKWKRPRRVVIKAEVVTLEGRSRRDNPRFVITNLPWTPRNIYRFYAKRGDVENRIKELKDGLRFDLTSCTRFEANQFRALLTSAAYALFQQLRWEARGTACARAQVWILRERLIKVAAVIRESVRRILFEAPPGSATGNVCPRGTET